MTELLNNLQASTGSGVKVAVIDSGLDLAHPLIEAPISAAAVDLVDGLPTMTDPAGHVTTIVFDEGRRTKTVDAPAMARYTAISDYAATVKVVRPSGMISSFVYEAGTNRMTAAKAVEGRTTWVYASGNDSRQPNSVLNRLGRRTTWTWNSAGQKTATINPLGQRTSTNISSERIRTQSP